MPKSTVYFYDNLKNLKRGVNKFFEIISKDFGRGIVGLKIHFGEEGNDTHIDPKLLKDVTKIFSKPKFVECNALYRGSRTKKDDHIKIAKRHGFGFLEIDILDGDAGEEAIEVEVNTENTDKAKLGKGLEKYKKLVALTHFKGHGAAGFGGAMKNVGMGLGSRGGKLDMHSSISPIVNKLKCTACGTCVANCNFGAIKMGKKAEIIQEKCTGCAMCIAVCPFGAIMIPWTSDSTERLMEKIADYTKAAEKNRRWWYINFLTNITQDCDCHGTRQKPIMDDIGILLSEDPVAIDSASIDLVAKHNNGIDPFKKLNGVDGKHILDYAEKIGLGTKDYELIEID
jgi:uncharacterized Fe-S center protein